MRAIRSLRQAYSRRGRCSSSSLTRSDGALRAASAELQPRVDPTRGNRDTTMTDPDGEERQFEKLDAELAAGRAKLPEGTEPCSLGAWSEDRDPKGLNVRAEPSAKARVLGTLPPPYRPKMGGSENTPDRRLADRIPHHRLQGRLVPDRGRDAAGQGIRGREEIPAQRAKALCRARLGRRQQGRRQLRQWRHAHGRAVPGAASSMRSGCRHSASSAGCSIPTAARNACSPAAAIGDWWKARTAFAAGGEGCAQIR